MGKISLYFTASLFLGELKIDLDVPKKVIKDLNSTLEKNKYARQQKT